MASFMRAVDIHGGKGGLDALFINDKTPKPVPGPDEALVRIKAFGLNRMDLLQREGLYPVPPSAPKTLGVEFSGVVEALGGEAQAQAQAQAQFAIGDEVFGLAYGGAYAEYIVVSTRMLLHKPAAMAWTEAASIPEVWLTALQALHEVGGFGSDKSIDPATQTVLWHAGASGVSIAGIQLSRLAGAGAIYATAGSDEKCAFLVRELGATAAFNYKANGGDWVQSVRDDMAKRSGVQPSPSLGPNVIIDYIGADYFQKNLDVAALDAHIVLLAFLGGHILPAGIDISVFFRKRLRIEGSSLRSRDLNYQARLRDRLVAVLPSFATGQLKLFIDRVLPWTDIRTAHEYMASNASKGKIICTIP